MSNAAPPSRSRGMRDLLPDEMSRVRRVEDAFAATCAAWGYREVRTPVIEPLHLFTSAGTLSPQTLERVYSFLDWDGWSGERVVLRPDSTIPAARLYAERLDGGRTAKLFYRQNVFRFTDDDSAREEWQCGVELIGDTGVAGDVEVTLLALDALAAAGVGPVAVRVSHAGVIRAVLAGASLTPEEQVAAYGRLLDGDASVAADVEARVPELSAAARLLFEVDGAGSGYVANVRAAFGGVLPKLDAALDDLAFVVAALEARGIAPVVQAALARSFEYYSGIVVKFDVDGRRAGVGGRYDELIGLVGGKSVPASGFALYTNALADLAPAPASREGASVIVVPSSGEPAAIVAAHDAARELRRDGRIVAVTSDGATADARVVVRADRGFSVEAPGRASVACPTIDAVIAALEQLR